MDAERTPERGLRLPNTVGWGIALALLTALISGVAIYLNAFAVKQVPDAAVYTTLRVGLAALVVALLAGGGGQARVRALRPRHWGALVVLGVIGGGIPFLLFFEGLAQAGAPGAAFIHKTLFVWVALLAVPFLGEQLGRMQVAALGVLLAGQLLVAPPAGLRWGTGETLIAAATLLWSVEVVVARRLLRGGEVPSIVAGAGRLGFGLLVLVGFVALTGRLGAVAQLSAEAWAWIVVTGLLLGGYVASWYAALQRAPATVVTAVLVLGAVLTASLSAVGGAAPSAVLVGGYALIATGVASIVIAAARGARKRATAAVGEASG
jgi:drug/metabolite transporter (DMT)-like permease